LDDDFDILAWWKLKGTKYPVLARLTRDILVVPISTVASESTFSISGRILNPVRNSLSNESIETLVCGQDWLRASVTGMCCLLYVIWYTVVCYMLSANCLACCLLSVMAENGLEFGDKLWPNDDEVAPSDGVCGSGIWICMSVVTLSMLLLVVALLACLFVALLTCLFVALVACCLTGLLPCSSSSVVVAWSLCTLWLLGSQTMIFNDARD
jgi:hAT family C-terminal dimerisation region